MLVFEFENIVPLLVGVFLSDFGFVMPVDAVKEAVELLKRVNTGENKVFNKDLLLVGVPRSSESSCELINYH